MLTTVGDTITFISNFDASCTSNTGLIRLKAESDDALNVYLNGALILAAAGSSSEFSEIIAFNCGANQLKVILQNQQIGGMGVIFTITQEQTGCNNCCTDNMPLCLSCSSASSCTGCSSPAVTVISPSICTYCYDYMPNCRSCSSISYCTACMDPLMVIATNHS